ncbi:MAG: hypothetical protein V1743_04220 [Nanoarchaeota archaeon]
MTAMVNGRNYLAGQGFTTKNDGEWKDQCCDGTLHLEGGAEIYRQEFIYANRIDDILIKIALENGRYAKNKEHYYERDNVLRTSMQDNGYVMTFIVTDITREGKFFLARPFIQTPRDFALRYHLTLDKPEINNSDLETYSGIEREVMAAMQQEGLSYANLKPLSIKPSKDGSPIIRPPPSTIGGFTDPWEIEEPRIGPEEGKR